MTPLHQVTLHLDGPALSLLADDAEPRGLTVAELLTILAQSRATGIPAALPPRDDEDETADRIRTMWAAGCNDAGMAVVLGMRTRNVATRRRRLGLKMWARDHRPKYDERRGN